MTALILEKQAARVSAPDYYSDLGLFLFLRDARERLMCMLGAYFDDSGTHGGAPVVAVAGFIAKAEQWDKLCQEWQETLDWFNGRHGFKLTHFHMATFMSKQGEFKGMNKEQAEILLDKLVSFIKLRCCYALSSVMPVKLYEEIIGDDLRKPVGSPYTLCALMCMLSGKRWAQSQGFNEPMAFIFESGTQHWGEISEAFEKAQKTRDLGGLFIDDSLTLQLKARPPLQAADILAWALRRQIPKGKTRKDIPFGQCYEKLSTLQGRRLFWNRTRLEGVKQHAIRDKAIELD
jgi:hypothetical protein